MDLWFVHPDGVRPHDASDLTALLERTDGSWPRSAGSLLRWTKKQGWW